MPAGIKVTETLFDQIKAELEYADPLTLAIKNRMSDKTILQIKGCATFADYTAMKQAQHPPQKSNMRETLAEILRVQQEILRHVTQNRLF